MLTCHTTTDGTLINSLSHGSVKRVQLSCDTCGAKSETTYANYMRAQRKSGNTGQTKCRSCGNIASGMARRGKVSPSKGVPRPSNRGKNNPRWKGGRYIDVHGYVMVLTEPGRAHSDSGWNGYHKEHVVVAENQLGRLLNDGEVVHHKDGNRSNNDPANLWVTDHAGHRRAHQSLQELGYLMIRKGLLTFDPATGSYAVAHTKLRELLEQP